jgi:CBS domain-containing protein
LALWRDGQLLGMVIDRDICWRGLAVGLDRATAPKRAVMTREFAVCFREDKVPEAVEQIEHRHMRRLAPINRDRSLAGLRSVDERGKFSRQRAGEVIDSTRPGR